MKTWEDFQAAYKNASEATKKIIDDELLSPIVSEMINGFKIGNTTPANLARFICFRLLGVYKSAEELSEALTSIGIPTAFHREFITAVDFKLASLSPDSEKSVSSYDQAAVGTEDADLTTDIAQAEAELAHVVSVRTMARDMHDLQSQDDNTPVHQSTQPAVRAPAPLPVPPTPSTAPKPASSTGTGPRWDSQEN